MTEKNTEQSLQLREFRQKLEAFGGGNRMDQLSLLELGDVDLGIMAIDELHEEFFIVRYKSIFIKTLIDVRDGWYIGDSYIVSPEKVEVTRWINT